MWCPSTSDSDGTQLLIEGILLTWMYETDAFRIALGAYRDQSDGTLKCSDSSLTLDVYLDQMSGYDDDANGNEDCVEYVYSSATSHGLNDITCATNQAGAVCYRNMSAYIDPEKFSGASPEDIALIQECVLDRVDPYVSISNLAVISEFSKIVEKYETSSTDSSNSSLCIESLTAMMTVDATFEEEFGCEIEYNEDIGSSLPMYEIYYEIWFTDYNFSAESGNRNSTNSSFSGDSYNESVSWQFRYCDTTQVYAERIEDIIGKSDTIEQAGLNIAHNIIGINNDMLDEEMIVRMKQSEDVYGDYNYEIGLDSFQYNSESIRPFYITTDDWESESCTGYAVTGLTQLGFDTMLSNVEIDVKRQSLNDSELDWDETFAVSLSNFIPYFETTGDDWNILLSDYINYTIDSDQLVVNIDDTSVFEESTDCWVFEVDIPSYVKFEKNYISSMEIVFTFSILNFTTLDDSETFDFVVTLTDNKYYVAISIKCNDDLECGIYFNPNETQTELGRQNPRYLRNYFVNWQWSSNKNIANTSGVLTTISRRLGDSNDSTTVDNNGYLQLTLSVVNDPVIENSIDFAANMDYITTINGETAETISVVEASYNSANDFGSFSGLRDMILQFGHYVNTAQVMNFEYTLDNLVIEKRRISASNSISNNGTTVNSEDEFQATALIDCQDDDIAPQCQINGIWVDDDNLEYIIDNITGSDIAIEFVYPTGNGYFTPNEKSVIRTDINACCAIDSNLIWMIVVGCKYLVFGVGIDVGYSHFPYLVDEGYYLGSFDCDNNDYPTNYSNAQLSKRSELNTVGIDYSDGFTIEIINDEVNNTIELNIYDDSDSITILGSIVINNDSFDTLETIKLYFISYDVSESYSISSLTYFKELIPVIEFGIDIESSDDFFEQLTSAQSSNPQLLPALFEHEITLVLTQNDTIFQDLWYSDSSNYTSSNSSSSLSQNYWQITVNAAFDTDCYSDTSRSITPGYARMTLYAYNESTGSRDELYDISLLQTECPATIELFIEYPTSYDPRKFLSNCSVVYYNENGTNYTETVCQGNELISYSPFIIEWSDHDYDYLFRPNYIYSNQNYSAGISYKLVYDVVEPVSDGLWLAKEQNVGMFVLLLLFPIFACIFGLIMFCCNASICMNQKIDWFDIDSYVIDGAKIRQTALRDIKMYHFTSESQFLTKKERRKIDQSIDDTNLTPLQRACNWVFFVFAVNITIVYGLAFIEKTAQLDGEPLWIFEITRESREEIDSYLFPTFFMAFLAISCSTFTWIVCCACGCYYVEYKKLYAKDPEKAQQMLSDAKFDFIDALYRVKDHIADEADELMESEQIQKIQAKLHADNQDDQGGNSSKGQGKGKGKGKKGKKGNKNDNNDGAAARKRIRSTSSTARTPRARSARPVRGGRTGRAGRNGANTRSTRRSSGRYNRYGGARSHTREQRKKEREKLRKKYGKKKKKKFSLNTISKKMVKEWQKQQKKLKEEEEKKQKEVFGDRLEIELPGDELVQNEKAKSKSTNTGKSRKASKVEDKDNNSSKGKKDNKNQSNKNKKKNKKGDKVPDASPMGSDEAAFDGFSLGDAMLELAEIHRKNTQNEKKEKDNDNDDDGNDLEQIGSESPSDGVVGLSFAALTLNNQNNKHNKDNDKDENKDDDNGDDEVVTSKTNDVEDFIFSGFSLHDATAAMQEKQTQDKKQETEKHKDKDKDKDKEKEAKQDETLIPKLDAPKQKDNGKDTDKKGAVEKDGEKNKSNKGKGGTNPKDDKNKKKKDVDKKPKSTQSAKGGKGAPKDKEEKEDKSNESQLEKADKKSSKQGKDKQTEKGKDDVKTKKKRSGTTVENLGKDKEESKRKALFSAIKKRGLSDVTQIRKSNEKGKKKDKEKDGKDKKDSKDENDKKEQNDNADRNDKNKKTLKEEKEKDKNKDKGKDKDSKNKSDKKETKEKKGKGKEKDKGKTRTKSAANASEAKEESNDLKLKSPKAVGNKGKGKPKTPKSKSPEPKSPKPKPTKAGMKAPRPMYDGNYTKSTKPKTPKTPKTPKSRAASASTADKGDKNGEKTRKLSTREKLKTADEEAAKGETDKTQEEKGTSNEKAGENDTAETDIGSSLSPTAATMRTFMTQFVANAMGNDDHDSNDSNESEEEFDYNRIAFERKFDYNEIFIGYKHCPFVICDGSV